MAGSLAKASMIVIDRFDDPNLARWTKDVGTNNSIQQVTESKTYGNLQYTETRVDFIINAANEPCRIYMKFPESKDYLSLVVDILLPDAPSTDKIDIIVIATDNAGNVSGCFIIFLNTDGKLLIEYTNTAGSSSTVSSSNTYAGSRVQLIVQIDLPSNYARVVINGSEIIEITDFDIQVATTTHKLDYVVLGTKSPPETTSFSIYSVAFMDTFPSAKFTISGFNKPLSLGVALSKELGVYAVPYVDVSTGKCYIKVFNSSNDSEVTTIDLNETVNTGDLDHEFVACRFINEAGSVYLYCVVGRHDNNGTLIKIDPQSWSILWKKTLEAGSYPQIAVYGNKVAVIQRQPTMFPEHEYMHVFDGDGNLLDSIKVINAGSGIAIYCVVGVENSRDGRYLLIVWAYYDSSVGKRYNVYGLLYDARNNKWYAINGTEKTLPVEYNDSDCLISSDHQIASVHYRNGKFYIFLDGMYDPAVLKVIEFDPQTFTMSTVYDGSGDDIKACGEVYGIYDNGMIAVFSVDEWYRKPGITYPYFAGCPRLGTVLDLENRSLVFINFSNKIEVYELEWTSTDSPNAETALYAGAAVFTITDYPSSVNVQPNASFTVKVTVKNEGSASGTVKVQLKDHNGNVVDYKNVSIGAGEVWTVELSATAPAEEGAYTWTVEAYNIDTDTVDDSKTITINVSQALYLLGSIFDMLIQLLPYLIMLIIIVLIISLVISATR